MIENFPCIDTREPLKRRQYPKTMNPKPLYTLSLTAVLGFAIAFNADGKAKASPTPAAVAAVSPAATAGMKKPRAIPYHGKIASVDGAAKTFMVGSRTLHVTSETVITKDGAAANMSDITVGEEVRGSYWKRDDGSLDARSVKLGAKADSAAAIGTPKK
jgi:hypothetical protein